MRDQIQRFMQEYPEAKGQPFANNPFGIFVRNEIPQALYATGLVDREKYLITASVGAGNWAMIPWICIFDRSITTTATKGVYIVYLLSKDSKRLYLTFNQGCTEIRNQHTRLETINIMHQKAEEIRAIIQNQGFSAGCDIDLGEGLTELGVLYREGTIFYKRYDVDAVPKEEELRNDLSRMMGVYKEYANKQNQAQNEDDEEWRPLLSEYDPGITKERWLELLDDPGVFNSAWKSVLAKFYDFGGTATCKQIELHYGGKAQAYNKISSAIGIRVHKVTQCPLNSNNNYFTILFFGRYAKKDEEGTYVWKMRPELYQALTEYDIRRFLTKAGQFDSWTIVDEETAIKHCDKSFYDYNGSGVPKGICWFFEAEDLNLGQIVSLKLLYQGIEYNGLVRNESSDRRRVRIFWNADLGKLLKEYSGYPSSTATFTRLGDGQYRLEMAGEGSTKGDEAEMKVSEKINQIRNYISGKGFTYPEGLIENFYLSLKSKPFVILAGTSGTGKTRLVRLFAEAIGANDQNGQYKQIAVRPDWSDSTDLFGHVDLNGHFVPGAVLEFLSEAQRNPDHPYILCLDEMNLARVEYYLSDFLSVIETRDFAGDRIKTDPLVRLEQYGKDENARKKYGEIYFPENLYVVGTVNMDETTFPFSRKVLDRANTIEFNYVDLVSGFLGTFSPSGLSERNTFLRTEMLKLAECPEEDVELVQSICKQLEEINKILQQANAHVGYRVRDEICFYMLNNRKTRLLSEDAALDNEIMQKILPRIQGSSVSVKEMLRKLFINILAEQYDQQDGEANGMRSVLENSSQVRYPKSAEKVMFMMRRFEEDGFTSYWL